MSYRRTKQIVAAANNTGMSNVSRVQPEDDWNLVANPSVYLDELPQPYRFIN